MSRVVISDMSQLVISDLSFCESELPEQEEIRGADNTFFKVILASTFATAFDPAGKAAAGVGVLVGLAIGDNIKIALNIGSIAGKG